MTDDLPGRRIIYSASLDESTVLGSDPSGSSSGSPTTVVVDVTVLPVRDDTDTVSGDYELDSYGSLTLEEPSNVDCASLTPTIADNDVSVLASRDAEHLRTSRTMQLLSDFINDDDDDDADNVALRSHDLWTARWLRRQKYGRNGNVYGVFGLFQYLADLKLDLAWAQEAAHRRQLSLQHLDTASTMAAESWDHEPATASPLKSVAGAPYLSWTDFERAYQQQYRLPYFSIVLFALCTIALIASIGLNNWKLANLSVNPMMGPPPEILIQMGALDANKIVMDGEWYRILTAIYLHAGIIHYAINMLALMVLGRAVEHAYGSLVTATVFVVSAVGGNIASALLLTTSYTISVGASGGLFALLGVCLADICANWDLITLRDPQHHEPGVPYWRVLIWLVLDLIISVVIGLTPYVDNCIHVGGFVYALGMGLPLLNKCSSSTFLGHAKAPRRRRCFRLFSIVSLFITVSLYTATSVLLFTQIFRLDDQGRQVQICASCRYMSCVPFPFWKPKDDRWWSCDGCDHVAADVVYEHDVTEVTLVCPFSEEVAVSLSGILDEPSVLTQLSGLCRAHCHAY